MKKQIFISYRRDGGEALAQLLNDRLKAMGYGVFYDIESLKSGPFDTKLYGQIEECEDFLLVLPPQALDRCIYKEDWVRCEIRHALEHQKNIIPIMMRGFVFPKELPDDISKVSKMNGVEFETMEYFDAKIDKIVSMLKSKPGKQIRKLENSDAPSLIRNVCTLASCDFDNAFPKDGTYTEVINRDLYNIIYFHLKTVPITDKKTVRTEIVIYDSKNHIVYNDNSEFNWQPTYDMLSLSWVIKGRDGSFVKTGVYRAEFRMENSAVYEYYFKITSANESLLKKEFSEATEELEQLSKNQSQDSLSDDEKLRTRPKGLLLHIATFVGFILFISMLHSGEDPLPLFFGAGALVLYILMIIYTRKYVCKSLILAMLLPSIFHFGYGIYLLVTTIVFWVRSSQKKQS